MKKILMFGTMLSVASAALAFGGVFGGDGHKSTTYKGGVDAIGVHFGGEKKTSDSQPEEEEETCPPEKQCGDYCCQGDNVCNTGSGEPQCCSETLNHCCPSNQTAYRVFPSFGPPPDCCNGTVFCGESDGSGNCLGPTPCCEEGKVLHGPLERSNGEKLYVCCQENEQLYCYAKYSYGCDIRCCDGIISPGTGLDGADECLQ